ncbi:MAG TPA: IclR family transcriptional regulator C-terminal domain-containing protein [Stellaceae bacterium]|nr:IclR family transcriptional regulator C-terminal domain-containing protein [Stellaceae bacterium]
MSMKLQSGAAVKSAARALDVVEEVARRGPANARAISRATGIPESSLSYLLGTLADRGWLAQAADRTYVTGPALQRLTTGTPAPLEDRARAVLRELTASTGETSSLFVRRGSEIEAVEVALSSHFLRFTPQTGLRFPLHGFAAGKAILAALPAAALDAYLAEAHRTRFTAHTLTDEAALRRDLARTRERGYAVAKEEHTLGVIGIGIALDPTLAISVAIPSPRFDADTQLRTVAALQRVRETLRQA